MTNPVRLAVLSLILFVVLTTLAPVQAQESAPPDILVRNLTLVDGSGGENRTINILIRNGVIDLVTEDKISRDEAEKVINANGGFVFGKLDLGLSPSFIVLDQDPRTDFDVLLDTKTHAVFAINEGVIVKNTLADVVEETPEDEPKKSGWLAYAPPPFAVPLEYRDADKWNRFDTKYINGVFTAATILDRMYWPDQNAASLVQVGDLSDYEGGEIRGLRAGVVGTLNFEKPWVYTIFGATHAFDAGFDSESDDGFSFFDYRLDIPFFKNSVMSIGKQKEPISAERIQSMIYNSMQERSAAADALLPSRNLGIVWNGSHPDRYTTWAFGVFNNFIDSEEDFSDTASQFITRVTWAPLVSEDESNLLQLGFSYRYSDAKQGFRFFTEPEFNQSPVFVDTGFGTETGLLPAEKFETYNTELQWRRGPLWLASEYTWTDVENPALGNPTFDGYFISGTWALTGEMRNYLRKSGTIGNLPIARSTYQNGKGAWELAARWSDIDLNDGLVEGGDMQIASLGLNWWLTPFFMVNFNYRYIWNELGGLEGTSSGFQSRVLLILD